MLDCIRDGVTTIFDHHASFCKIPGSLFAIKDVCRELGIRANLCYEVSERDGEEKCRQAIRENADFARWAKEQDDDMIKAMFGGHALFTISDKTFEEMVKANDGMTGFHIHVAEGMNDVYDSLQNYGCRPVNRLLYNGILGEKTMLGHCIHLSPAEMDIVRETNTMVCHNPESNMGNAVGCAPVLQMYQKGILIGLGTDAYTHDMLESLKVLLPMQRHNTCQPKLQKAPGRPQARRRRRRDRHGLQALHPLLRRQHRRPHALRHDGQELPHHHHQRQGALQRPGVRGH